MKFKHKVKINIADRNGHKQEVLQSEHRSIPKRLLTFLFGEFCEVLVLTPGETVQGMTGKKPYCQFKAHIKKLNKQSFIMTGFLEDSNGELYGDRFIQAATPYIEATEI